MTTNTSFTTMTETQMLETNAGKTYTCPFCKGTRGSFWNIYYHALNTGCFKKNAYLRNIWAAGWGMLRVSSLIKGFIL